MKKYILLLLILIVVFILLLPKDDRPDLTGDWNIRELKIDKKELLEEPVKIEGFFIGPHPHNGLSIRRNSFVLSLGKNPPVEGKITFPDKDTIVVDSGNNGIINSKYRIAIDTVYDVNKELGIKITLTSSDKKIELYRRDPTNERNRLLDVMNNRKRPRGTP